MNGFGIWLGAGVALGLWRVARGAPRLQANAWINLALILLIAALLGARLWYVGINWIYFAAQPLETLLLHSGGLSWPGAFLGAAVMFLMAAQRFRGSRFPLGWVGDRLYPLLPMLSITAWLGCWSVGSAYGKSLEPGVWWGLPAIDETGLRGLRVPLQPFAALSLLLYFSILEWLHRSQRATGSIAAWGLAGLLAHLLVTSLLRGDPAPLWQGQRIDTWLAGAFLAVFLAMLAALALNGRLHGEATSAAEPD